METISKKDFADLCGVTKTAIGNACKAGKIKTVGEGRKQKVNLSDKLTKGYLKIQKEKAPAEIVKKKIVPQVPDQDEEIEADDQLELDFITLDNITPENSHLLTKNKIDILDKVEAAKTKRLDRSIKRMKYIDRTLIEKLFARLYTIDKDEFKAFEERLTPEVCGIFGFQPDSKEAIILMKLLNKATTGVLTHRQRKISEFIKQTKEKKNVKI